MRVMRLELAPEGTLVRDSLNTTPRSLSIELVLFVRFWVSSLLAWKVDLSGVVYGN